MANNIGQKHDRKRCTRDMAWLQARVEIDPQSGCWEWKLTRNKHGYGYYGDDTGPKHVTRKAHRLAFNLAYGYLPERVLHGCDNPPCCNPAHLRAGTQFENVQDMLARGRCTKAKITPTEAKEIRDALANGAKGAHLARAYSVSEFAVGRTRHGQSWAARQCPPMPTRQCPTCQQVLAPTAHANRIYCSTRCAEAEWRRRRRVKIQEP